MKASVGNGTSSWPWGRWQSGIYHPQPHPLQKMGDFFFFSWRNGIALKKRLRDTDGGPPNY